MATFHVFGVPVTFGFDPVPAPETLGDEYLEARKSGDNERMYQIENTMDEEYGLVFGGGMWQPSDHDEEEEQSGGNWFTRMFG